MSNRHDSPVVRVYRVVWRDRDGILHGTAPRFLAAEKAQRFARLLRNDPAVVETRVVPVVLRPLLPLRDPA
jgi:hypothetical protein